MTTITNIPVVKQYEPLGAMQRYDLAESLEFTCAYCGRERRSATVATIDADAARLACSSCYATYASRHRHPEEEAAERRKHGWR